MIGTLYDLMRLAEEYAGYLAGHGVQFDDMGFPLLDRSCFLVERPELMVTFKERHSSFVKNPKKTALCFFCSDKFIYPRLERVFDDLPEYNRFMAVAGTDVTITKDMDMEWQRMLILVNSLFLAVLAINGIKIVPNLRCGLAETWDCLSWIPERVLVATSTLGCQKTDSESNLEFISKILMVRPAAVLMYGKRDAVMEEQLVRMGVAFIWQDDVHTLYKKLYRSGAH